MELKEINDRVNKTIQDHISNKNNEETHYEEDSLLRDFIKYLMTIDNPEVSTNNREIARKATSINEVIELQYNRWYS